eukprot:TRINITY_DN19481_c0_g1_i1.p2 TRINITY_DN19481_c0_g1~~TRINITY_DN19481_c0_g1_i1.p2  ORF type:complete len:188 (+),score=36.68 TRINITY_DN19481_c0_g1_i1:66-629(+)
MNVLRCRIVRFGRFRLLSGISRGIASVPSNESELHFRCKQRLEQQLSAHRAGLHVQYTCGHDGRFWQCRATEVQRDFVPAGWTAVTPELHIGSVGRIDVALQYPHYELLSVPTDPDRLRKLLGAQAGQQQYAAYAHVLRHFDAFIAGTAKQVDLPANLSSADRRIGHSWQPLSILVTKASTRASLAA